MYPPPRGIIPLASASIEASEGSKAVEVFDSYGSSLSFFGSSLRVSCLLRCAESHYSPHLRASLLTSVVSVFFSLGSQRPGEYLLRCVLPIVLRASGPQASLLSYFVVTSGSDCFAITKISDR